MTSDADASISLRDSFVEESEIDTAAVEKRPKRKLRIVNYAEPADEVEEQDSKAVTSSSVISKTKSLPVRCNRKPETVNTVAASGSDSRASVQVKINRCA